jgi:hypothetical protein
LKRKENSKITYDPSSIITKESEERAIIRKRLIETDGSYETIEEHNSENLAQETEAESEEHTSEEIEERETEIYDKKN